MASQRDKATEDTSVVRRLIVISCVLLLQRFRFSGTTKAHGQRSPVAASLAVVVATVLGKSNRRKRAKRRSTDGGQT